MTQPAPDGIEEIREQLPRAAAVTGAPMPGGGRELPSIAMNEPTASLCRAVAQSIANTPLFRRGNSFVTVDDATGEELPMNPARFRSWHTRYFLFHENEGEKRKTVNLRQDLAVVILSSDELRSHARALRHVNRLQRPTWRGEGANRALELLPKGYDAATQTFTVQVLQWDPGWQLEDAQLWYESTFGSFPFFEQGDLFSSRSFAALVCGMVGVFGADLLRPGAVRPMIVVNANQSGAGKSTLLRAMLTPTHGLVGEGSKPKSDDALRDHLASAALAGKTYVVLDDVHNLASSDLNAFITSPAHELRVKGQSLLVISENKWQVFVTGNQLLITEDLDRRSLLIDLFCAEKPDAAAIANPLTSPLLLSDEYRSRACSASWALLRHWFNAGSPRCSEAHKSSFEDYVSLFASVVVAAGFANPFAPRECSMGGDEAGRALQMAICKRAGESTADEELTTDDVLSELSAAGTRDVVLSSSRTPEAEKKSLGWKLAALRGKRFTDTRGRRFEFGRREDSRGSRYTLHFLDAGESIED